MDAKNQGRVWAGIAGRSPDAFAENSGPSFDADFGGVCADANSHFSGSYGGFAGKC